MALDQYPVTYTRIEGANAKHVGRLHGKLGQTYTWKFIYDFSEKPEDQLAETVVWEWMFRVYDKRGVMVYQASSAAGPLLRSQSDLRHIRLQAEYQAQLFLEEHLRLRFDAGSSSHHRKPQGTV